MTLNEDGAGTTVLAYVVKADVGGKIAQLGGRLIDSTAKKLATQSPHAAHVLQHRLLIG